MRPLRQSEKAWGNEDSRPNTD